jgi:hypothetical protein
VLDVRRVVKGRGNVGDGLQVDYAGGGNAESNILFGGEKGRVGVLGFLGRPGPENRGRNVVQLKSQRWAPSLLLYQMEGKETRTRPG